MSYIEIYPIERYIQRASDQLDKLVEANPRMYTKTKERYKKLAVELVSCAEKIIDLLDENSLAYIDDAEEFAVSNPAVIDISDISSAVSRISGKVNQSVAYDKDSARYTVRTYANLLSEFAEYDFGYIEVNDCFAAIWRWFDARFVTYKRGFKYNLQQLPNWISNIILLYGMYRMHGLEYARSQMDATLDTWIAGLSSETSSNWAVPYPVHKFNKECNSEDYTMYSVIVNDILYDKCLHRLSAVENPNLVCNMDCYDIPVRCAHNNSDISGQVRTRVANMSTLIQLYELHTSKKVEVRSE